RTLGPLTVRWVTRQIADERADLVHVHTVGSQMLGTRAARRAGVPLVRTEHSTRVYKDRSCWPFARWSLRRADAIVACSHPVRELALRRLPEIAPRTRTVPHGVDVARFSPRPHPAPPLRFVLVGRFDPRKGIDVALQALASVPAVPLDIVGDGS